MQRKKEKGRENTNEFKTLKKQGVFLQLSYPKLFNY